MSSPTWPTIALVALAVACRPPFGEAPIAPEDEPPAAPNDEQPTAPAPPLGVGCVVAAPMAAASMQADIAALAAPALAGRAPGTDGDRRARALIEARFRCLGLTPAGDAGGYQQAFSDGRGHDTANLIGFVPGTDAELADEIILVGAHHDHLGAAGGVVHPGANDDASGIAAMLAVAAAIDRRPPRRTVAFVAFGAEEDPARTNGSTYYVDHAPTALPIAATVAMINLDMVGSYDVEGTVNALGSFRGTAGRAAVARHARSHPDLQVDLGEPGVDGDHLSFCDVGIPYLFFWTDGGACYHQACDTADRIDGGHLEAIAALVAEVTRDLADSEADLAGERGRHTCDGRQANAGPARLDPD